MVTRSKVRSLGKLEVINQRLPIDTDSRVMKEAWGRGWMWGVRMGQAWRGPMGGNGRTYVIL